MKEIEAKILNIDKDIIKSKLELLGAKYLGTYDYKSIFLENINGKICRIRDEGNTTVINMKKEGIIENGIKQSEEYEIFIDKQFYETINFFQQIGFKKVRALRKKRTNYNFLGIKYSIDETFIIPDTIEIEAKNIEEVNKGASLLGYTDSDFCGMSENQVYKFYSEERGLIFQHYNSIIPYKNEILKFIVEKYGKKIIYDNKENINHYVEFLNGKIYYNHNLGDLGEIFTIIYKLNYFKNKCSYENNINIKYYFKDFFNQNINYLYEGFIQIYGKYISNEIIEDDILQLWNEICLDKYFSH